MGSTRPLGNAGRPHHDGSDRYVSTRRPALGTSVTVRLRVPHRAAAEQVYVRSAPDGEPRFVAAVPDGSDAVESWWRAEVAVVNPTTRYRFLLLGGAAPYRWVTACGTVDHDVTDQSDFWLTTAPAPPAWLDGTVAYQIFPDRFRRSGASEDWPDYAVPAAWSDPVAADWKVSTRQLYGGDLPGVVDALDHIAALGANLLYLTPVFPSRSAHRYDAAAFDRIDPFLGGDAAYAELIAAAHARGMRVIGDLTTNHTGSSHDWFRRAQSDAASREASFYFFRHHPDDYDGWFGVRTLPKLDHGAPALHDAFFAGPDSITQRWMRPPYGIDGWRIDVANMTGRHGAHDHNRAVARAMRASMAEVDPETWLVAEHCYDASEDLRGDGWHGTMNYAGFTRPVHCWLGDPDHRVGLMGFPTPPPVQDARAIAATMRASIASMPWRSTAASLTLLDSHDTARFRSVAGSFDRHVAAVALLATYPGVPMVFAGDEVGCEGADSDAARVPFPWDESRWDHALLREMRALIGLRRSSPALQRGGLRFLHADGDDLVLERDAGDERIVVQISRCPIPGTAPFDLGGIGLSDPEELYRYEGGTGVRIWRGAGGHPSDPGEG